MRGSPYSTARWQRLRRAILERDDGICQIRAPGCTLVATTCDHIYPASTHPELFWAEQNLRAACRKCTYRSGSRIAHANTRATIAQLRALVEQQDQHILQLLEKLAQYENDAQPMKRATPGDPLGNRCLTRRCLDPRSCRGLSRLEDRLPRGPA